MKQLLVRSLNLAVIAAVLLGYNTVLDRREKEDQIAQLSAELETTKLQKESLEAAAKTTQNAAASEEAASDASAADTDDTTASPYLDGTYEGEAEGFGGMITVQVTVEKRSDDRSVYFISGWRRQRLSVQCKRYHSENSGGTVCRCRHNKWCNIQLYRYQKCHSRGIRKGGKIT